MSNKRIRKKRKYLDDLGVYPLKDMVPTGNSDKFKKERKIYGFDSRETYNLDTTMYYLLYERVCMFLEKSSDIIDFTYYKFDYKGKEYTQEELMDILLDKLKTAVTYDFYDYGNESKEYKERYTYISDIWEIWNILHEYMWW